jgi:hypothetical protein
VIAYLEDGNAWAAERLSRDPGWVLHAAMRHPGDKTSAAYLQSASSPSFGSAGRPSSGTWRRRSCIVSSTATATGRRRSRLPTPTSTRRADGVLIEVERGRPMIVDRSVHRELVKAAIERTHDELQTRANAAAREEKAARSGRAPADPLTAAKRERDAAAAQAHRPGAQRQPGPRRRTDARPAAVDRATSRSRGFARRLPGSAARPPGASAGHGARLRAAGRAVLAERVSTDVAGGRRLIALVLAGAVVAVAGSWSPPGSV